MQVILLTLIPIFTLIALGNLLRRTGFLEDAFWRGVDRLVFYIMFPALLFSKTAGVDLESLSLGSFALAVTAPVAIAAVFLFLTRNFLAIPAPSKSSIFQAGIRMNVYIGFGAATIAGHEGAALAALASALMVPFVNVLCVIALVRWHGTDGEGKAPWSRVFSGILKHPLILSIIAGFASNLMGLGMPPILGDIIAILAKAALPMALLSVGAALRLSLIGQAKTSLLMSMVAKFLVLPVSSLVLCQILDLPPKEAFVAFLFAILPTAVSGYHMARQMGGDAPLSAGLISAQTLASVAILPPAMIFAAWYFGLSG